MGKLGNCCCCCITEAELPEIAIANMTGAGWVFSDCCAVQQFTYDDAQEINQDCFQMKTAERTATCVNEVLAWERQNPFNNCPIDPCDDYFACGEETSIVYYYQRWNLVVSWRRTGIQVGLAKVPVTCDGVTTCKYVLFTDLFIEFGSKVQHDQYDNETASATASGCCYVQDSGECTTVGTDPIPAFDCDAVTPASFTGSLAFRRYKVYDTLPTGTTFITLGNADSFPAGCTVDTPCFTVDDHVTEYCVTYSTPIDNPDWCSDTSPTLTSCNLGGQTGTITQTCTTTTWDGEGCIIGVSGPSGASYTCPDYFVNKFDGSCGDGCEIVGGVTALDGCNVLVDSTSVGCYWENPCPPNNRTARYLGTFQNILEYTIVVNCSSFTSGQVCIPSEPVLLTMVV